MFESLGTILSAGSALSGAFGGGDEGTPYGADGTMSAYDSMPQWLKDQYEQQYGPEILEYFKNQSSPEQLVAPFHRFQENALQQQGQGIQGIQKDLGQYMNPYQQFVTDQINTNYNTNANNLKGLQNQIGHGSNARLRQLNSSSQTLAQGQNEEARQRALAEANYNNYNQALSLRRQTLSDMLSAGGAYQQQQQNLQNAPFNRLSQYGQLLGAVPGGQTQFGATPAEAARPDTLARLGGVASGLQSAYDNGAFSSFGGPKAPAQPNWHYGPQQYGQQFQPLPYQAQNPYAQQPQQQNQNFFGQPNYFNRGF